MTEREQERAAIIAWLRDCASQARRIREIDAATAAGVFDHIANAIEAGDHLTPIDRKE